MAFLVQRGFDVGLRLPVVAAWWSLLTLPAAAIDWCEQPKLLPGGGGGQNLGTTIDVASSVLVIGNKGADWVVSSDPACNSGSVFVYRDCGSQWVVEQELRSPVPACVHPNAPCNSSPGLLSPDGAQFGQSVATDGVTIAVGSQVGSDVFGLLGGEVSLGRVDLFVRVGSVWVHQQSLLAPAPVAGQCTDGFGFTVDLDGDNLAVGAHGANGLVGAVHLYRRDGLGVWQPDAVLASPYTGPGWFGQDVALDGDRLLVGAPRAFIAAFLPGAAYVFDRGANGWTLTQTLTACAASGEAYFGDAVAIDGSLLACSAPFYGPGREGRVYTFELVNGSWTNCQEVAAFMPMTNGEFGTPLALHGDVLAVSSIHYPSPPPQVQGTVYLFRRSGGSWIAEDQLLAADGKPGDHFGNSVALSADTAAVGAPSVGGTGAAYTYRPPSHCLFTACGKGCPGPGGCVPVLCMSGTPKVGGVVNVEVVDAIGGGTGFLLVSTQCLQPGSPIGFGCLLNVSPVVLVIGSLPLSPGGDCEGALALSALLPPVSLPRPVALQAVVVSPLSSQYSTTNAVSFAIQ